MEANNERLLQLINEILDLSKIEAGIVEFSIAPVRLYPLCKEIHDAHVFRCPSDVELIFEPSDEDIRIDSDKNRIFQVISNLIGNAFKFTTHGSISYGYHQEGENIIFHVTDTGTGIAPEKIGKVFERFVKANNFAQGTGLGLAICKTIIELSPLTCLQRLPKRKKKKCLKLYLKRVDRQPMNQKKQLKRVKLYLKVL